MRPLGLAGYLFGGLGRPGLQVLAERCLRASGSDCRACVAICPATALRLGPAGSSEAPQTELTRCTDCGLCAATCPSGAIAGVGVPPGALTREAERQSSSMNVVCAPVRRQPQHDDENPDFSINCLAALHPETVVATALALQPGSPLTLRRGQCSACPSAQQARVEAVVSESVDLLQRLDESERTIVFAVTPDAPDRPQPGPARRGQAAPRGWSRRELLTARRSGARPATAPAVTRARAELLHYSAGPSASASQQLMHPLDAMGCTFCHACAVVCPTQALRIGRRPADGTESQDDSPRLELAVDPARCLGCRRCAEVCVDDLLTLGRGLGHAMGHRGRGLVVIAQGNRSSCDTCEQPLAPSEQGICRRCESAGTLVADVLALKP